MYDLVSDAPRIFHQKVLLFGSRRSVHGFCRTSIAVWKVLVVLLTQQMNVYFDDFVGIEVEPLSKLAEMGVSLLFKLLGWDVSSDKKTCFDSVAKVLGLKIDLSESRLGKIYFRNTDSRRDDLFDSLSKSLEEGRLARKKR